MTRTLTATYRLQFHKDFGFADAERLIPYFRRLGVSHLYASPIFAARAGSTHGYDIVDPTRINPELGGEEGFGSLVAHLHEAGLGLILDIVPNHMAAARANEAWMKALAFGPGTQAARIFDIDWSQERVLVPVLGDSLHSIAQRGEIHLEADWEEGFLLACYAEHAAPLRPASVASILERTPDPDGGLAALAQRWRRLEIAAPDEVMGESAIEGARSALRALDPAARGAVAQTLARQDLGPLLDRQHWRFAHWRTARDSLTYRRFFNITELISLRVEDPWVFEHTHRLIVSLVKDGLVDALRVDHIDGLADPEGYCQRLRAAVGPDCPIFVEKILGHGEALRDWPIEGTTGYERLNEINGLFVASDGYERLARYLEEKRGITASLPQRLAAAKRQLLHESFVAEVEVLAGLARELAKTEPQAGDYTREGLRRAVVALVASFPVYRSYASERGYSPEDEAIWRETLETVEAEEDDWTAEMARFLIERLRRDQSPSGANFRMKFQQLTGPAMAKGYEDTLLYRSMALASANEVGGHLESPTSEVEPLHEIQRLRAEDGARDLTPLATHDTKRGAETRARLNLLSTQAERWIALTQSWEERNAGLKTTSGQPDSLDEWLIYQTLFAAWPISTQRMADYLTKALREAKRHTRWEHPNEAYEEATIAFATALIEDPRAGDFRRELSELLVALEPGARINAIAQTILQTTLPGTPDIYQGSEFWDRSLVDPDNRRPVDWGQRLALIEEDCADARLASDDLGVTKLRSLRHLLGIRRAKPGLFAARDYRPLFVEPQSAEGDEESATDWIAFQRLAGAERLLVLVPLRGVPQVSAEEGINLKIRGAGEAAGTWRDLLRENQEVLVGTDGALRLDPQWPFLVAIRE